MTDLSGEIHHESPRKLARMIESQEMRLRPPLRNYIRGGL